MNNAKYKIYWLYNHFIELPIIIFILAIGFKATQQHYDYMNGVHFLYVRFVKLLLYEHLAYCIHRQRLSMNTVPFWCITAAYMVTVVLLQFRYEAREMRNRDAINRVSAEFYSDTENPTLIVTCQCATLPSAMCPRVSTTSNQRMSRIVCDALLIAFSMASCIPTVDEPVSSIFL
jgi:hypothetical protein